MLFVVQGIASESLGSAMLKTNVFLERGVKTIHELATMYLGERSAGNPRQAMWWAEYLLQNGVFSVDDNGVLKIVTVLLWR